MTRKEIQKIRVNMEKPENRKSKYGFKDMKPGETIRIPLKNGDTKTDTLKIIRTRCAQESVNGRTYAAWSDEVGVYYKRTDKGTEEEKNRTA